MTRSISYTYVYLLLSLLAFTSAFLSSTSPQTVLSGTPFPSLLDVDLEELNHGLGSGWFTSVDLVRAYVARINEVNDTLHMVTQLNPDAEAIAAELDLLRAQGTILSPLHGIPILIKDNIATDDKMSNTAGSWALHGSKAPRDATVVAKLRKAGAIILGKTNLSEWANFRSYNTSNGWSGTGGQTYGVYLPGQDPTGSSSGSGVAGSIGLSLATIGTETSGSILSPADVGSLAAVKPTVGLTSRYLVVPISQHQDTIGPMGRNVKDLAYLLQAIAGVDAYDNYTSAMPDGGVVPDYVAACDYNALVGKRIGVARNVLDIWSNFTDEPVLEAFEQAVREIEAAGATIVEANFTHFKEWTSDENEIKVMNADFISDLANYFSQLTHNPNEIHSLEDMQTFTHNTPSELWPLRDTLIWHSALKQGWNNTAPEFWEAYQMDLFYGGEGGVLGALERTNTDAILLPTQLAPAIPALVGSPVVTVPMGYYPADTEPVLNVFGNLVSKGPGKPFGLSFMGARWSEADLLGFAYAYEQRTMHRHDRRPYIVPNTEISDVLDGRRLDENVEAQVCSAEFVQRCQMVESWPRTLRERGTKMEKSWWTEIRERDGYVASDEQVQRPVDET